MLTNSGLVTAAMVLGAVALVISGHEIMGIALFLFAGCVAF